MCVFCLLQNVGTLWYFLTIEREDDCWHSYCRLENGCDSNYLYCSGNHDGNYDSWFSTQVFNQCNGYQTFNFGIYQQALVSGILGPGNFLSKLCYCFWWGLQNLRYSLFTVWEILMMQNLNVFGWFWSSTMSKKWPWFGITSDFSFVPSAC